MYLEIINDSLFDLKFILNFKIMRMEKRYRKK